MRLNTRLRSWGMRFLSSERYLLRSRHRARKQRVKHKENPTIHYYHQVDDPYSHLMVQAIPSLLEHYQADVQIHLVSAAAAEYQGDADRFPKWGWADAKSIAPFYDTEFSPTVEHVSDDQTNKALQHVIPLLDTPEKFAQEAHGIGKALWSGEYCDTSSQTQTIESTSIRDVLRKGNNHRDTHGHYQGAMLYFEGEWFWGLDRLRLLEARLIEEGLSDLSTPAFPQPTAVNDSSQDHHSKESTQPLPSSIGSDSVESDTLKTHKTPDVVLEYFPSLRSPYTAVGHSRVLKLIQRWPVEVQVRPVMPMLMRGIPAPAAKQRYIITDAGREGRYFGSPLNKIVDPFGEPVKRAFALFPAADAQGLGMEFVTSYLQAAWSEGIDITTSKGLQLVVERIGLNWHQLNAEAKHFDWASILQQNLDDMLHNNLWGVPSFRVSGGIPGASPAPASWACWGQDRIWRVEAEISERIAKERPTPSATLN